MTASQDRKKDKGADDMVLFRQEAARLRKEFDTKIRAILERIRERKLKEIQEKIKA